MCAPAASAIAAAAAGDSVEDFLTLDDSLLSLIQASARVKGAAGCMQQAAATLQRLQRRDTLYQWAAEAELAPAQVGWGGVLGRGPGWQQGVFATWNS